MVGWGSVEESDCTFSWHLSPDSSSGATPTLRGSAWLCQDQSPADCHRDEGKSVCVSVAGGKCSIIMIIWLWLLLWSKMWVWIWKFARHLAYNWYYLLGKIKTSEDWFINCFTRRWFFLHTPSFTLFLVVKSTCRPPATHQKWLRMNVNVKTNTERGISTVIDY